MSVFLRSRRRRKQSEANRGPRIIFDTDFNTDIGDPYALGFLMGLFNRGECSVIAAASSSQQTGVPGAISGVLRYYGLSAVPVAGEEINPAVPASYQDEITDNFDHAVAPFPDPVTTYRQVLHDAPDASVVICVIGFSRNIAGLLASSADGIDSRNGVDLVAAKCVKGVIASGEYPTGTEYNFQNDPGSAHDMVANWPSSVPLWFSGYEIGSHILSAVEIYPNLPTNPIAYAAAITNFFHTGREAWDSIGVLLAVRGLSGPDGTYFSLVQGTNSVNASTGTNTFTAGAGNHFYAVQVMSDSGITNAIDSVPVGI